VSAEAAARHCRRGERRCDVHPPPRQVDQRLPCWTRSVAWADFSPCTSAMLRCLSVTRIRRGGGGWPPSRLNLRTGPCVLRRICRLAPVSLSTLRWMAEVADSELVVGLVTPVGTQTDYLAKTVQGFLTDCGYIAVVIKLSDLLPIAAAPVGECEDHRVKRLIAAGNSFCEENDDSAAIARLAVREIRRTRLQLLRQDRDNRPAKELVNRPRTAYILHSLKRTDEVELLREIYGGQFILVGCQGTRKQRKANLLRRNLSATSQEQKEAVVDELMAIDAGDQGRFGQNVNGTYPRADFFLHSNDLNKKVDRMVGLLFGEPIAPTIDEYAMYVARASAARSLAASRKVGAAIVVDGAVVATGYNDVPDGQKPDVLQGIDTSEQFKRDNLRDTLLKLQDAGMLNEELSEIDDEAVTKAAQALERGELMSVIEYQRAVHAEARAIDDATVRGISTKDGTLYVTTYHCHLCYKHALSARLKSVEYIEPYSKSRAVAMFPLGSENRLTPFAGVAPRRYMATFDDRPAFLSVPPGIFETKDRRVAHPILSDVRDNADRAGMERSANHGLREEYQ
jgi:deoxycytidylate deaminase